MNNRFHHIFHHTMVRIAALIMSAVLTWSIALPGLSATAAQATAASIGTEAPTGTLTIRPKYGDQILTASEYDGTFKIYHIADYASTGTFTKDAALDGLDVTIDGTTLSDDESYKELSKTIAAYIAAHSDDIEPRYEGIKADAAQTLPYGLYLITPDALATGYLEFESFLAMIPDYSNGVTNTTVTAYPKVAPEPDEPDEPDEPGTPDRPRRSRTPGTPSTPATPDITENGSIEEAGAEVTPPASIEEAGAFTGDTSHMMLYGTIALAAIALLIVWTVRHKRAR